MVTKKEAWGYGFEITGLMLFLTGVFLLSTFSSWDQKMYERQFIIQEEVNLAVLSSLNDIASIQSTDDKEFREALAKNVADTANQAYSKAMAERERRMVSDRDKRKTGFWKIEIFLMTIGGLLILRGRWIGLQDRR